MAGSGFDCCHVFGWIRPSFSLRTVMRSMSVGELVWLLILKAPVDVIGIACARQHDRGGLLPTPRGDTDGGTADTRYGRAAASHQ